MSRNQYWIKLVLELNFIAKILKIYKRYQYRSSLKTQDSPDRKLVYCWPPWMQNKTNQYRKIQTKYTAVLWSASSCVCGAVHHCAKCCHSLTSLFIKFWCRALVSEFANAGIKGYTRRKGWGGHHSLGGAVHGVEACDPLLPAWQTLKPF